MTTILTSPVKVPRLEPKPLAANIASVQPGGGRIMQLELAWGRLRRGWLRTFRRGYVERMRQLRRGDCPNCPHDIIDSRDLKFFRNVCGFHFDPNDDRFTSRSRRGFARMGWMEIVVFGGSLFAATAALVVVGLLTGIDWITWLAIAPAAHFVFVLSFFRDPERATPTTPATIVSPADGTVDDIEELDHCEFIDGPAVKIGIFLSVFNVHVNRTPESSRVIEVRYVPGRFGNAMDPAVAKQNEQLWLSLEADDPPHRRILVKQIAGAIARRIVCEVRPGERLERGRRFGMIKFGSRTELYLPKEGLCVAVKLKDTVRGAATVIARFNHESTP